MDCEAVSMAVAQSVREVWSASESEGVDELLVELFFFFVVFLERLLEDVDEVTPSDLPNFS